MGLALQIFGALASIAMILGYLPQAIMTIRTRDTDGIAMPTFLMMALGSLFFIIQGFLIGFSQGWALIITNIITFTSSLIVFIIKLQNDSRKRKESKLSHQ